MQRIGGDILIAALLFVLLVLYSLPSLALQPVEAFVAGARQRNPDALEARANLSQQEAQADSALGRVLPGVTARGSYTRAVTPGSTRPSAESACASCCE